MKKTTQSITGDNNVQVGVNNGQIINTKKVKQVTEVLHDATNHITDTQALQIREKITEIVDMVASNGTSKAVIFPKEYGAFYKQYGITKYTLLPKALYDDAINWLQKRSVYLGKKTLRHGNNEEWRKKQYTAINTRSRQLKMDRDTMLLFAMERLELKQPLQSIKDLSDTRLQKLYNFIMTKSKI
jgi:hypothetical protein